MSAGVAGGNAHIAFRIEPQCLRRIGNEAHKLGLYPFKTRLQLWINRCVPCWVLLIDLLQHSNTFPGQRMCAGIAVGLGDRSEEHTPDLQSRMRISYAVFCLNKKTTTTARLRNKS